MRLATWNVNSAKARLPRLLDWLDTRSPDVVSLQETKLSDAEWEATFGAELTSRGYAYAHVGEGRWNGVAILSRVGLEDVAAGFPGQPGYPDPAGPREARAVAATCGGIRVWSLYVPNGRTPDDPHFVYKLAWLRQLAAVLPAVDVTRTVLTGDMNIAPADADVWDIRKFGESTHVTPQERDALAALVGTGLTDVVRRRWPEDRVFTYWDYRAGAFHQDLGMRIDLVLAGSAVADRVTAAWVDRQARKGSGPSDHAPVMVDLDEAPDGDIGPMVPPPSARRR